MKNGQQMRAALVVLPTITVEEVEGLRRALAITDRHDRYLKPYAKAFQPGAAEEFLRKVEAYVDQFGEAEEVTS